MNKLESLSKALVDWEYDEDVPVAILILLTAMQDAQNANIIFDDEDKTIIEVQQNKIFVTHNNEIVLTLEVK